MADTLETVLKEMHGSGIFVTKREIILFTFAFHRGYVSGMHAIKGGDFLEFMAIGDDIQNDPAAVELEKAYHDFSKNCIQDELHDYDIDNPESLEMKVERLTDQNTKFEQLFGKVSRIIAECINRI